MPSDSPQPLSEPPQKSKEYPTPFQRKTIWTGLSYFFVILIGGLSVGLIWLLVQIVGFLQPLLVPLAAAAVIAYLLYPLVDKLRARGLSERRAGVYVFLGFMVAAVGLIAAIIIPLSNFQDEFGEMPGKAAAIIKKNLDPEVLNRTLSEYRDVPILGSLIDLLPFVEPEEDVINDSEEPVTPDPAPRLEDAPPPVPDVAPDEPEPPVIDPGAADDPDTRGQDGEVDEEMTEIPRLDIAELGDWVVEQIPTVSENLWRFIRKSVGGFLGAFGFVIGFFLVPIYLFFFLRDGSSISKTWSHYLPLRQSAFKNEVVGTLQEINGYLIAFFRGQMLVSLIDGLITAVLLSIVMPKYGLLIGVMVGFLGVIPFLGIMICYIPAIIIATVQGASGEWWIAERFADGLPWWVLPLIVTLIFIAVNNLDGVFIAPKIVGDSVGLHPLTVIFSVLFWSSVVGGLLGALLAVPLTASVKVLFGRYIWQRRIRPRIPGIEDPQPALPGPGVS